MFKYPSRESHLAWCKERALQYVEVGQLQEALTSMFSDLTKHPETMDHPAIRLGFRLMVLGKLNTASETRRFIEGFN